MSFTYTSLKNLGCLKLFFPRSQLLMKSFLSFLKFFCVSPTFLAHLSRRLTRWAYSIPLVHRPSVVRPSSVRHCPHFQTWISQKPVGQSWSAFMCSITGVGERLHKVLGQIGSKLVSMAKESPHWLKMGKMMSPPFLSDPFYTELAGNENMHKISDKFEFQPDQATDCGVSCPWASKNFPIDL